jgi:hypothetical protein
MSESEGACDSSVLRVGDVAEGPETDFEAGWVGVPDQVAGVPGDGDAGGSHCGCAGGRGLV